MFVTTQEISINGQRFRGGQSLEGVRPSQIANLVRLGQAQEVSENATSGSVSEIVESEGDETKSTPIEFLGLPAKTLDLLAKNNITTIEQLGQVTELTALEGIGEKTAEAIQAAYIEYDNLPGSTEE